MPVITKVVTLLSISLSSRPTPQISLKEDRIIAVLCADPSAPLAFPFHILDLTISHQIPPLFHASEYTVSCEDLGFYP